MCPGCRSSTTTREEAIMNRRHFTLAAIAALLTTSAFAADIDYGKPGTPVKLVGGYQPYYTPSWAGGVGEGEDQSEGIPEPEHRGDHVELPRRQARRCGDLGADRLEDRAERARQAHRFGRHRAGERCGLNDYALRPDQAAARRGQGLVERRARRAALHLG